MTRGRVLFLHPSLRERVSPCRSVSCGVWRFRELFLRREGLSVQVGRGFHDHAGGARLMTGRAGAAMRCSCPGRRGHGEGKGDGFVPQSGGSGSATGAALVPQAAEQRGPVSVRGLRARQEFPGASCAARVFCGLCALRRRAGCGFCARRASFGAFFRPLWPEARRRRAKLGARFAFIKLNTMNFNKLSISTLTLSARECYAGQKGLRPHVLRWKRSCHGHRDE